MFVIFRDGEVVHREGVGDTEVELLKRVIVAARRLLERAEYAYVRSKDGEYVGVFRGEYAVFVRGEEEVLGLALLKAEKVLLDFLHQSEGQHV
ncbi:hypothetical protein [Pyrobaculum aerophilum]|uniref:Uncharacterized protein n=1 Tax=Pyrobaculum aerophilum TaxID=13773 RepID=A0A371QY20_9CREN|nr:hypothetical protein [Pyrobaculum aerophilum]RFA95562.1 hypothetical protein CGL52_12705 [Pyrobaculum aerophilum]RFA98280.1 hypothetical protein CGL51_00945 [Pyrobaculum aerophilum]